MKVAKVSSVCECQSRLGAELDPEHKVLRGWTRDRRGRELNSPCTRAGDGDGVFHLVWLCAYCGRNTLRSFDAAGLVFQDRPESQAHA